MENPTAEALKMLFDEDLYLVKESSQTHSTTDAPALEQAPQQKSGPAHLTYKGDNLKGVAVLVDDATNEYLNPNDETLLLTILKAVNLSLQDVALCNLAKTTSQWQEQLNVNKAILFGISPETYGKQFEMYKLISKNDIAYLFAHPLSQLSNDKSLKLKLWGSLKEMFE